MYYGIFERTISSDKSFLFMIYPGDFSFFSRLHTVASVYLLILYIRFFFRSLILLA